MTLPASFEGRLSIPAVAAPMFLTSGPDLVVEACKAGVIGGFPALNQRTSEGFDAWLQDIGARLAAFEAETGRRAAPYGVNLIVHRTNPRVDADLALCVRREVPLIITSLGAVKAVVDAVHGYGGVVFHDVTNLRHAVKAVAAGVDGLILVCAGAGGHAGTLSPFALVPEIRRLFDGTIVLAGCISRGDQVAAAEVMGADLAYIGTRFIATRESTASEANKRMILESRAADIVYTPAISGIPANFLGKSLEAAGLDLANLPDKTKIDLGEELDPDARAWRDIWSAGQGVGSIEDVPTTAELCEEYSAALAATTSRVRATAPTAR